MKKSAETLKEIIDKIEKNPDLITEDLADPDPFFTDVRFSDIIHTEDEKILTLKDRTQNLREKLSATFPDFNSQNRFLEYYYDFLTQIPENWKKNCNESEFSFFDAVWPTYSQMDNKQRDYYFFWRDQFRKGNYLKTDTGYLKLFAYELLTMSQIIDIDEISSLYLNLLLEYGQNFDHLKLTLSTWYADLLISHYLDSRLIELPEDFVNESERIKNYLLNKQILESGVYLNLNHIESLSGYKIRKSPLYQENENLYQSLFPKILVFSENFMRKKYDKGIFETFSTDKKSYIHFSLYPGAVTPDAGTIFETEYYNLGSEALRTFLTQILKFSENQIRKHFHYRGRLKIAELDPDLKKYLTEFINRELNPPIKAESRSLSVNKLSKTKINTLREQSDEVRKSLEVEDLERESENSSIELLTPVTEPNRVENLTNPRIRDMNLDEELTQFLESLQPYHLEAIQILYDGQDIQNQLKALADKYISLPELIIDEINELAYEVLDNLFIESDDGFYISEEYRESIEEFILNET